MKESSNRREWFQILSNVAIVAGLIFVIFEMYQTRVSSQLDVASDFMSDIVDFRIALQGENPGELIAKACLTPDELSEEDLFILQYSWSAELGLVERYLFLENVMNLAMDSRTWVEESYRYIATFKHGILHLRAHQPPPEMRSTLEAILSQPPKESCSETFRSTFGVVKVED